MIDPMGTKLKLFLCFVPSGPAFKARRSMGGKQIKNQFFTIKTAFDTHRIKK